jgi:radical SAM superfamily enzyme YgiQ (UPF0313 family)
MKISLIAPPLLDYEGGALVPVSMDALRTCPPYAIYLLAAVLRREGHEVAVIDLIAQGSKELSLHWGTILSSDLVGIGTTSLAWPAARQCIFEIRRMSSAIPIVLGGIHASMFDTYLLATTEATAVVRGEAEATFPKLCRAWERGEDLRTVPNLSFRSPAGRVIRTELAPKLTPEELATFPIPDYASIPAGVYAGLGIESSRGCPHDCAFCSTSYRQSWRAIAAEAFVDRVEAIMPHLGRTAAGILHVIDDEFTAARPRAIRICQELVRRGLRPQMVFDARAEDLLDVELLEAIQPHARQFLVGAECGYDEGLHRVGKHTTVEHLEKAAALLAKYRISSRADFSFVIGFPWETKAEVMRTVRFAAHLYSDYGIRVLLQWYCQIPGSRLWDEQRRNQVVHEAQYDDYGFFRNHYLFRTGVRLSPSEVHEVHEVVSSLRSVAGMNPNGLPMIQSSIPEPIMRNYPALPGLAEGSSLENLRELARAGSSRC